MKEFELREVVENLVSMEEKGIKLSKEQRTIVNEYFNTPSTYNIRIIAEYTEDFDIQPNSEIDDAENDAIELALEEFEEKMANKIDSDFSEYSEEIRDKIFQWVSDNFTTDVDFIDEMPADPFEKAFFQQFLK